MRRLVLEGRVARIGTVDPDGRPHLVPFCYALDNDALYSEVDEKPKSTRRLRRLENIRRDPRVTILVDHYEEDWPRAWWVRLRGPARVVEGEEELARARQLLIEKYPQYREDPPTGDVFAVDIEEWLGWSYSPVE
jgi:PPOX class probable F420-dependent enzyme